MWLIEYILLMFPTLECVDGHASSGESGLMMVGVLWPQSTMPARHVDKYLRGFTRLGYFSGIFLNAYREITEKIFFVR